MIGLAGDGGERDLPRKIETGLAEEDTGRGSRAEGCGEHPGERVLHS